MRTCIYAGSFDPPTIGHLDMIRRAGKQFDLVFVAVAHNPAKKGMFSSRERMHLLLDALGAGAEILAYDQVLALSQKGQISARYIVTSLPQGEMLVRFAQKVGAQALIRGLRAVSDFEFEIQMANANARQAPDIETVLFMAANDHLFVSSSIVREIASLGGDVSSYVPPNVEAALKARIS